MKIRNIRSGRFISLFLRLSLLSVIAILIISLLSFYAEKKLRFKVLKDSEKNKLELQVNEIINRFYIC